ARNDFAHRDQGDGTHDRLAQLAHAEPWRRAEPWCRAALARQRRAQPPRFEWRWPSARDATRPLRARSRTLTASMPFSALGLPGPILRGVRSAGYTTPTPVQQRAIPLILAGH